MPKPHILTEDEVLQFRENLKSEANKEPNKYSSLVYMLISIGAFYISGVFSSNPFEVIILMVILFFHEMGHLITMKIYGYQDLKVFFIPFMGAIVIGQQHSTSQYKKALVSLMGPLPGIVLGIILFETVNINSLHLVQTINMLLLINAFNLLPLFPLDGGRIIDDLFSKNILLRVLFTLLSGIALIIIGIKFQDWVLLFLAILTWFGLNSAIQYYKASNIKELVGENLSNVNSIFELPIQKFDLLLSSLQRGFRSSFDPVPRYNLILQHLQNLADQNNYIPSSFLSRLVIFILHSLTLTIAFIYIIKIFPILSLQK